MNNIYQFTGIYDTFKDAVKPRLAEIRKLGFKAEIRSVKSNKYSRSHSAGKICGYSVYAEPAYGQFERLSELKNQRNQLPADLIALQENIAKAMEAYESRKAKIAADIAELETKLANR